MFHKLRTYNIVFLIFVTAISFSLSGCGGSGSGGSTITGPPANGPTNVAISVDGIKSLRLDWDAVLNAHHYAISVDDDGDSQYDDVAGATDIQAIFHSMEIPVHRTIWGPSRYVVDACDAGNIIRLPSDPIFLPNALSQAAIGYLKASNTEANDHFGYNVAISADGYTVAVTALNEDSNATGVNGNQGDNSELTAGAVFVFRRTGNSWAQEAYLKASNTDSGDYFGRSLALSSDGNTLAVSADGESSAATGIGGNQADDTASSSGAVYIFTRSGTTWAQQAYIKASNAEANDKFGSSVSLSSDGNTLAVGAKNEDSSGTGVVGDQSNNDAMEAGAAYIFIRTGSTWSQQAYIKASNTAAVDHFGHFAALSGDGNTLAVSAIDEDSVATGIGGNQADDSAGSAGAVYVYTRAGTIWSFQAYIKASNTDASDNFGYSIALCSSGNTLAIGAWYEDSNASGIDGDDTDDTEANAGAVYVFSRSGTTWAQQAYIKASNTETWDRFGRSVALSFDGNTLAAGAYREGSSATGVGGSQTNGTADSGAVYLYSRTGTTWSQESYIKASNTGNMDFFGHSVDLSSDGNTMVVGAYQEDSSATGVSGDQADNSTGNAGAVYLY